MGEKQELYCHYHRDVKSEIVCEKCGKFVCTECKQGKLCPECLYTSVVNKKPPKAIIFIAIFSIFFLFISIFIIRISIIASKFCFATLFVLLIGTIIGYVVKKHLEDGKAKEIRDRALDAIHVVDLESTDVEESEKITQIPLYCRFCGAAIKKNENTCQYCGMTWIWK